MSSAGINPLALYDPSTYAQQLAIQRRQQLAQSLLSEPAQGGAYGGLAGAGNKILGAFLAKRADRDLGNLYNPQSAQTQPQSPAEPVTDPGSISNAPDNSVTRAPLPPIGAAPDNKALGAALSGNTVSTPQQSAQSQNPPDYASLPPQAQHIYDQIPHIPGMPAKQALNFFLSNPTGYQQEWAKMYEQTDLQKNAGAAYGQNTPEAQQMLQGTLAHGAAVNMRPGGGVLNMANGQIVTMPGANGVQTQFPQGANGPAQMSMAPGAAAALEQSTAATGLGKAATTPAIAYDANNQPVATNQAQMLGGDPAVPGGVPNIDRNNPWNVSPGGSVTSHSTPMAGFGQAWDNLGAYAKRGINTVAGVMNTWAPYQDSSGKVINPSTPQNINSIAQQLGVKPDQPINISDPEVRGRMLELMRPTETGSKYSSLGGAPAAQSAGGGLRPELPQGQATYMQGQAKDAADRHDQVVAAASESPMRINVLDNIINLSKSGVATGPGQEWQNNVAGYIANTPLLSKLIPQAQKDGLSNFQELQKFTYQNAIRSWQAAGGTGTDAQMQSMAHANPNDHLFPQALQQIAQWGKAAELAVQGKANAQDAFLAQNGQNPQAQIKFESTWRNAFDPKVFQYSLMSPQERQTFAQQELKTPQAAKAFLAKQQQLKALGALQ